MLTLFRLDHLEDEVHNIPGLPSKPIPKFFFEGRNIFKWFPMMGTHLTCVTTKEFWTARFSLRPDEVICEQWKTQWNQPMAFDTGIMFIDEFMADPTAPALLEYMAHRARGEHREWFDRWIDHALRKGIGKPIPQVAERKSLDSILALDPS